MQMIGASADFYLFSFQVSAQLVFVECFWHPHTKDTFPGSYLVGLVHVAPSL